MQNRRQGANGHSSLTLAVRGTSRPSSCAKNPFYWEVGEAQTWLSPTSAGAGAGSGLGHDPPPPTPHPLQGHRWGGEHCSVGLALARQQLGERTPPEEPPPRPSSGLRRTAGESGGGAPARPKAGRPAVPVPGAADLLAPAPRAVRPDRVLPAACRAYGRRGRTAGRRASALASAGRSASRRLPAAP